MKTQLIPFHFESHVLRVERDTDGEPIFHANDLCAILGYKNPWDAVRRHVEQDDLVKREVIDSLGRTQMANWVREPGLWSLILGSETEQAKRVKRWVTSEVLPAIRKTGGYRLPSAAPEEKTALLERIIALQDQLIESLKAPGGPEPATLGLGPRAWTAEEDRQLIELRRQGLGFTRIGYRLGRSGDSCRKRWRRLQARLGDLFAGGAA